jgi:hypothetical protein
VSYQLIATGGGERRHDHRYSRPLVIIVDGIEIDIHDWGFGGMRLPATRGLKLNLDDEFVISHILDGQGAAIPVFATAKVARICVESGDIGAAFQHLGEQAFNLLEQAMFRRRAPRIIGKAIPAPAHS